jgi:hypothetical protein
MIVRVEEQVGYDNRSCAQQESGLLREMGCAAEDNCSKWRKIRPVNGRAKKGIANPVKGGGEHKYKGREHDGEIVRQRLNEINVN